MNIELFLVGLLFVSTLTGLTVEGLKKLLEERNIGYHSNALAGIVSCVLSIVVGICYLIDIHTKFNMQLIVYLVALVFLSWLCAMLGYDKVIQAVSQFKTRIEED